jgi:hypothetical protein
MLFTLLRYGKSKTSNQNATDFLIPDYGFFHTVYSECTVRACSACKYVLYDIAAKSRRSFVYLQCSFWGMKLKTFICLKLRRQGQEKTSFFSEKSPATRVRCFICNATVIVTERINCVGIVMFV